MMNITNVLKKLTPALVLFVFILGALNVGSYDPYNELNVLTPDVALAQLAVPSLGLPSLSTPTLNAPTLSTPVLATPEIEEPELSVPEVVAPVLNVPELDTPTLTTPVLETPTLTTPTIINPILVVPELPTPTLSVPTLNVPTLTNPTLSVPVLGTSTSGSSSSGSSSSLKICDFYATTATTITVGSSITLSWSTSGYSSVTINGETVSNSGTKTFTNIQSNTTYTLVAKTSDGKSGCTPTVVVTCVPPVVVPNPTCEILPRTQTIFSGQTANLSWTTTNASSTTLSGFGLVSNNGTRTTPALTANTNYILTVTGTNGHVLQCEADVLVQPKPTVKYCELTLQKEVSSTTANPGDELTYTIKIRNTGTADCTGGGVKILDVHDANLTYVSETHTSNLNAGYGNIPVYTAATKTLTWNGNTLTPGEEGTIVWKGKVKENLACDTTTVIHNTAKATAYELNNFTNWAFSNTVETSVHKACYIPVAQCDAFTVSPTTIKRGESATLAWSTTNASRVVIDNAIGEVSATGTYSIAPLATTTYMLTAYGVNDQKNTCTVTIGVEQPPVVIDAPKCEAFTATPASLPVGGGDVVLTWATKNAGTVSISPTIGIVAANGSTTIGITTTQTFTLTTSNASSSDSCVVTVPVQPPVVTEPLTCAANVTLSASPTRISRGGEATLTWTTTGVTGVSFDNGITATGLSGSTVVSPSDSTTYTLTATNGTQTINCPVPVTVETGGGGGGGSSAPRCELSISDNKINAGDEVVLTWNSTRATDITLEDETEDEVLVTTTGLLSSAKSRLLDGKITVSPDQDTTYVLTVKRGSTTRKCTVDVELDNNVVVKEIRDQQPLVSGIALTQVPYTGFEAGPILTLLFYTLLMAWALYIAYLLVIKRDVLGGLQFAAAKTPNTPRFIPEQIRPDVFVASVKAPEMPISTLPTNLPTGTPAVGYANHVEEVAVAAVASHQIDESEMTKIENHAHQQRVLLSSDAIRHFIATTNSVSERTIALDQVIVAAKAQFPAEDGWVVLNEKRMQDLCVICAVNAQAPVVSTYIPAVVPQGAGSLAEAIVTGNVVAAYELIGNRPMFALADAAADLDAVYRIRRGIEATASELLMKETAMLTNEQILKMIEALTGALDGTYTDEASAVKVSIMKAIKVVA